MSARPENIFPKHTLIHDLMEGALQGEFDGLPGWEDLTAPQIAEVLGTNKHSITGSICTIWKRTGYEVPYKRKFIRGHKAQT